MEIPWEKYKGLALRGDFKVAQGEKWGENRVLVCIYLKTRGLVVMLIMNL